jgi:hypothetical protein
MKAAENEGLKAERLEGTKRRSKKTLRNSTEIIEQKNRWWPNGENRKLALKFPI